MRDQALPRWVVDDDESIRQEMARYVNASPAELWRLTEACARDAMWALLASDVREAALAYQEPLPRSTKMALERLRIR
jgi:hypothetical protein